MNKRKYIILCRKVLIYEKNDELNKTIAYNDISLDRFYIVINFSIVLII